MTLTPYYSDDSVTLYCGDMRKVLCELAVAPDCVIADPPYEETSLTWDRWPDSWPSAVAKLAASMWCFGSMRMLLDRRDEFDDWRFSQDVVWEKHNGSGFAKDRFKRVHEHIVHWYRGNWWHVYHETPRIESGVDPRSRRQVLARRHEVDRQHAAMGGQLWQDDGTRLVRSVLQVRSMHGLEPIHATEKPVPLLAPLIEYACPPGGLVLDPFAGSCSTGVTARLLGRRAVLIEADEAMCEKAVTQRLLQDVLPLGGVS